MENLNIELRQLQNTVEIVGTLLSKDLEIREKDGRRFVTGRLVVQTKINKRINHQQVRVFVSVSTKLFKGIETVMNEYKTIERDGAENADRVRVTGQLKLNEYYDRVGNLHQYNDVQGIFFTRLKKVDVSPDRAIASIDTIVEGYQPIFKNGQPTGAYSVQGFTVGKGNEVIELKDVFISEALAQTFMSLYQPGQTGLLTYKLNNYAEVEEQQSQPIQLGFGNVEPVTTTITNYVRNIELISGLNPYIIGSKEYTPEEIQQAKQIRALKLQELQNPAPSTPPVGSNQGFSQRFASAW